MQPEVILTIVVTLLCSVALMAPLFLCAALGCFDRAGQLLVGMMLIAVIALVSTIFLGIR